MRERRRTRLVRLEQRPYNTPDGTKEAVDPVGVYLDWVSRNTSIFVGSVLSKRTYKFAAARPLFSADHNDRMDPELVTLTPT